MRLTQLWRTAGTALVILSVLGAPAAARATQVTSSFVTVEDVVKIHYLEAGEGPAILFIPGWTMPAWIWENQIRYFARHYHVIAIDPRSQGESSQTTEGHYPAARARDIKAVVDTLNLAPVVLVGWSMGVTEVASYVDQFGTGSLTALVLVDDFAGGVDDPDIRRQMLKFASDVQQHRKETAEGFAHDIFKNPKVLEDEDYLERVAQASLQTPTSTAVALLFGYFTTDNRPALAKIDVPTLIIIAQSPWMHLVEDLHQRIAGSRLEVFENAGHALFVDQPDRFNALVERFLQGIED